MTKVEITGYIFVLAWLDNCLKCRNKYKNCRFSCNLDKSWQVLADIPQNFVWPNRWDWMMWETDASQVFMVDEEKSLVSPLKQGTKRGKVGVDGTFVIQWSCMHKNMEWDCEMVRVRMMVDVVEYFWKLERVYLSWLSLPTHTPVAWLWTASSIAL